MGATEIGSGHKLAMQNATSAPNNDDRSRPLRIRDAAERLDLSPIQVRRLIHTGWLRATRDNKGHWLVHLPKQLPDIGPMAAAAREQVDAILTNILMDDLNFLEDQAERQDNELDQLRDLAQRQGDVLEDTINALEKATEERNIDAPEIDNLTESLDRAMQLLGNAVANAEQAEARAGKLRDLLDRALIMIEANPQGTTIPEATLSKLSSMMDRALSAAEIAEESHRVSETRLTKREQQLDRTVELLENSLVTDRQEVAALPIWQRLFSVFSHR